jgi:hypothetical protein
LAALVDRLSSPAGITVEYPQKLRAAYMALAPIGESARDLMRRLFFFPSDSSLERWKVGLCQKYHIDDDIFTGTQERPAFSTYG